MQAQGVYSCQFYNREIVKQTTQASNPQSNNLAGKKNK
jgi:uncharacterized protein YodC (DUF2158 family)